MINPGQWSPGDGVDPAQDVGGDDRQRSDELRIRASNLALSGLSGVTAVC